MASYFNSFDHSDKKAYLDSDNMLILAYRILFLFVGGKLFLTEGEFRSKFGRQEFWDGDSIN